MIIDAHNHVMTWKNVPEVYWRETAQFIANIYQEIGRGEISLDQVKKQHLEPMMDNDGSKLIANMDASGVEVTFILSLDLGYGHGEARQSIDEINRFYGSIARQHPDRVVAFAGVDPRRAAAVEILDRAVNQYGCRGLKYHPTAGFYPDGEESYKVVEKARELGIPLLSHLGPISKPYKSKYARPVFLDSVVCDFPELTVIGAHLGFCWWQELVNLMAAKRTAFYADFSGHQFAAKRNYKEFCLMMRSAFDQAGFSRFLWGTDNPMLEAVLPMKDWLQLIKNLPKNAPEGIKFTDREIEAVLGGNAEKILKTIP